MAVTVQELQARLEDLRKVRASGLRSAGYDGHQTEYRSDAELAAAIADLERQIAGYSRQPVRMVYVNASKGI
jgi:hypothetical protein